MSKTPQWIKNLEHNRHLVPVNVAAGIITPTEHPSAPPTLDQGEAIKKWYALNVEPEHQYWIVVGLIDGTFVELLSRKVEGQIVVVEPDIERIRQVLAHRVLDIPRGKVLIIEEYERVQSAFVGFLRPDALVLVPTKEATERIPEVVRNCQNMAIYMRQSVLTNWATIRSKTKDWTTNSIENILRAEAWEDLCDQGWRESPALCVSAGPSLSESMDLIRNWKGPVFCVGHALRKLLNEGIKPHFVVYTESADGSSFFEGLDLSDLRLICVYTIHPNVMSLPWKSRLVFCGSNTIELLAWLKGGGVKYQAVGPSCANTAARAAWTMGCRTICLVGQDLAYTGRDYADGLDGCHGVEYDVVEPEEGQEPNPMRGLLKFTQNGEVKRTEPGTLWPAKDGTEKLVPTSIAFTLFMSDFLSFARDHWSEGAFIDFTAYGGMIHRWAWGGGTPGEYLNNMEFEPWEYTPKACSLSRGRKHIQTAMEEAQRAWQALKARKAYDLSELLDHPFLIGLFLADFDKDPSLKNLQGLCLKASRWLKTQLKKTRE